MFISLEEANLLTDGSVTGSSTGIGREIALECARHGAQLILHHIGDDQSVIDIQLLRAEINDMLSGSIKVLDIAADVTDPAAGEM